ncbi:TPA: hypothetical protein MDO21_004429 [Klebsiella pneumoniae]|nr:hypothetical protein [Klebsiella pneumoniae]
MFDLHTISFLLIFIAAGLVKGVTGMGLPTVAMGLLGLLMPPQAAAALLGMWLGQRIRSRLSPQRFRQGFLLFLLALGIELIARGWLV